MRFHVLRAIALAIAALLPTSCAAGGPVVVAEADAGREILLAKGAYLHVRLEALPGTGYRWVVSGVTTAVLESRGGVVFEPAPGAAPGGRQFQVLRFRAVGRGVTELELAYVRPWEQSA